jgi:hypothetical protein
MLLEYLYHPNIYAFQISILPDYLPSLHNYPPRTKTLPKCLYSPKIHAPLQWRRDTLFCMPYSLATCRAYTMTQR